MNPRNTHPIDFFNEWLVEPIRVTDNTVTGVVEALNCHPMAEDQTSSQNYVMPSRRCREHPGRFRIYGECQDLYYCFVRAGDESKIDPPVYLETCLDLNVDCGVKESQIIHGDHTLVAERFTDFLWRVLGHDICVRSESNGLFSERVTGALFNPNRCFDLDASLFNPLGIEFPFGHNCFVAEDVVCIPDWGAAFLNAKARELFFARHAPKVIETWA